MLGKIIFEGKTKTGLPIIIRYPTIADTQAMQKYINTLSRERSYIRFQGEQMTINEERKYLVNQLKKINKRQTTHLLAFSQDKLIGISSIDMKDKVEAHEGVFGISIAKDCRKQGVGFLLMETVIEEAIRYIPQLKILSLGVFANNHIARTMYKKFGFKKAGVLPKGVLHRGKYVDHIYMYKFVRPF